VAEARPVDKELEKLGERAKEVARKIGEGLKSIGEKLEKADVPRLVRNIVVISTGAMMLYMLGMAVYTMMPIATVIFYNLGYVIGFLIPLALNVMIITLVASIVRIMLR